MSFSGLVLKSFLHDTCLLISRIETTFKRSEFWCQVVAGIVVTRCLTFHLYLYPFPYPSTHNDPARNEEQLITPRLREGE